MGRACAECLRMILVIYNFILVVSPEFTILAYLTILTRHLLLKLFWLACSNPFYLLTINNSKTNFPFKLIVIHFMLRRTDLSLLTILYAYTGQSHQKLTNGFNFIKLCCNLIGFVARSEFKEDTFSIF